MSQIPYSAKEHPHTSHPRLLKTKARAASLIALQDETYPNNIFLIDYYL
jgi:hypothetical protein